MQTEVIVPAPRWRVFSHSPNLWLGVPLGQTPGETLAASSLAGVMDEVYGTAEAISLEPRKARG